MEKFIPRIGPGGPNNATRVSSAVAAAILLAASPDRLAGCGEGIGLRAIFAGQEADR